MSIKRTDRMREVLALLRDRGEVDSTGAMRNCASRQRRFAAISANSRIRVC
jgi:hypothetical protein